MRKIVTVAIVLIASLVFVNSASAFCGPAFSSLKSGVKFYKTPAGKKYLPSMNNMLVSKGLKPKDQGIMSFLEGDQVVYTKTPRGYKLNWNSWCPNGAYAPYLGNLKHSRMGVLAVRRTTKPVKVGKPKVSRKVKVVATKTGAKVRVVRVIIRQRYRTCSVTKPFMKAYCRNLASGKAWKDCKISWKTSKKVTRKKITTKPKPKPEPEPTPTPKPTKDGTTTPPPPPEAPGTNPPPSGGPGDPGSNKCYDEITGQPVNPRTDGTCPVGSYGG